MPDQAACRAVLPLMTNLETVHFTRGGRIELPDLNKKAQEIIRARNGAKPE
jgi:hypothetical protein